MVRVLYYWHNSHGVENFYTMMVGQCAVPYFGKDQCTGNWQYMCRAQSAGPRDQYMRQVGRVTELAMYSESR